MADLTEDEALRDEIACRAYAKFCDRGCVHGSDTEDWLAAEGEVMAEQQKAAETPETQENPPRQRNGKSRR